MFGNCELSLGLAGGYSGLHKSNPPPPPPCRSSNYLAIAPFSRKETTRCQTRFELVDDVTALLASIQTKRRTNARKSSSFVRWLVPRISQQMKDHKAGYTGNVCLCVCVCVQYYTAKESDTDRADGYADRGSQFTFRL